MSALDNVVSEGKFSNTGGVKNGYQGDENEYFPIQTTGEDHAFESLSLSEEG